MSAGIATSFSSFQPRPLKLPSIQIYIDWIFWELRESVIDVSAEYNVPSAVPQRSMAVVEASRVCERSATARPAMRAPKKDPAFSIAPPAKHAALTAPSVAPDVIPRMPGSASGFRNKS